MVIAFFNIGGSEFVIVIVAIVVLFGAKRIPEIARGFGKGIREFKNATSDIQEEIRKTSTEIKNNVDVTKSKPKSKPSSNSPDHTEPVK